MSQRRAQSYPRRFCTAPISSHPTPTPAPSHHLRNPHTASAMFKLARSTRLATAGAPQLARVRAFYPRSSISSRPLEPLSERLETEKAGLTDGIEM